MSRARELPEILGNTFTTGEARSAGVGAGRLRAGDLGRPFYGIRKRADGPADPSADDFERQREWRCARAHDYSPRMREGQFFSHETAAALWGAPLPLAFHDGHVADGSELPVHVSVFGTQALPRLAGVERHRARAETSAVQLLKAMPVAIPETVWAGMGRLQLIDLVALGDYFCRVWRPGIGRPSVGMAPIASIQRLRAAERAGRRVGAPRIREALELVREDSWSPRESAVRCILVLAGLPEPALNQDVYDRNGTFLGCLDLVYPEAKVAVEYHGLLHSRTYAQDVERMAALRAAGWTVIEVTAALLARPEELVRRVRAALRGALRAA